MISARMKIGDRYQNEDGRWGTVIRIGEENGNEIFTVRFEQDFEVEQTVLWSPPSGVYLAAAMFITAVVTWAYQALAVAGTPI